MRIEERQYQDDAVHAGYEFFTNVSKKFNGLMILPTGSGKSLVIARLVKKLTGKVLVLQPNETILLQNFSKFQMYGGRAAIYSASAGQKYLDHVTYATIGSVYKKLHLFRDIEYIIIDECHYVNPKDGMYNTLIRGLRQAKVCGLTATPYRLSSGTSEEYSYNGEESGPMLKFLTRTSPRIFHQVIYYVQNERLFKEGYLAPLRYFSYNEINRRMLEMNKTGTDWTEQSLKRLYSSINMPSKITEYANRILKVRKNCLVFCSLIDEAKKVAAGIEGAECLTDDTPKEDRQKMISRFRTGKTKCIVCVGMLYLGFDFPALEAVIIGRSTMSLEKWYQWIGRVMRPFQYADGTWKTGWVVDLGDNFRLFGRVETYKIRCTSTGLYSVWNDKRQLTNVEFSKFAA